MSKKLTPLQEAFCDAFIRCEGSPANAVRMSHPDAKGWGDKRINSEAQRMMRNTAVLARIGSMRGEMEGATMLSREAWLQEALTLYRRIDVDRQPSAKISVLDMLGRAMGYFAPAKLEIDDSRAARVIDLRDRVAKLLGESPAAKPEDAVIVDPSQPQQANQQHKENEHGV